VKLLGYAAAAATAALGCYVVFRLLRSWRDTDARFGSGDGADRAGHDDVEGHDASSP